MSNVELPIGFGGSFVEGLLVGPGAKLVELGVAGVGGDELREFGGSFLRRARVKRLDGGELHGAIEGGLDGGGTDDVLHPGGEGGAGCCGNDERAEDDAGAEETTPVQLPR
jgi:hypothetical protein